VVRCLLGPGTCRGRLPPRLVGVGGFPGHSTRWGACRKLGDACRKARGAACGIGIGGCWGRSSRWLGPGPADMALVCSVSFSFRGWCRGGFWKRRVPSSPRRRARPTPERKRHRTVHQRAPAPATAKAGPRPSHRESGPQAVARWVLESALAVAGVGRRGGRSRARSVSPSRGGAFVREFVVVVSRCAVPGPSGKEVSRPLVSPVFLPEGPAVSVQRFGRAVPPLVSVQEAVVRPDAEFRRCRGKTKGR
jgi:hypothetical protein